MGTNVTDNVQVVRQVVIDQQDDVMETVQQASSEYSVTKLVTKVVQMDVCETMVCAVAALMECSETYVIGTVAVALQGVTEYLEGVVENVQLASSGSFVTKHAANTVEMDVSGLRAAVMMVVLWENQEISATKRVMLDTKLVVIRIHVQDTVNNHRYQTQKIGQVCMQ